MVEDISTIVVDVEPVTFIVDVAPGHEAEGRMREVAVSMRVKQDVRAGSNRITTRAVRLGRLTFRALPADAQRLPQRHANVVPTGPTDRKRKSEPREMVSFTNLCRRRESLGEENTSALAHCGFVVAVFSIRPFAGLFR